MCRTYQRFTKAGVCATHCIKESVVTQAVLDKIREICRNWLDADSLLPLAEKEVAKTQAEADTERERVALQGKIDGLTQRFDEVYMDKLTGLLEETDFQRIYRKVQEDRALLERRLGELAQPDMTPARQKDTAKRLVEQFLQTVPTNRELLVSLIERVELTENRQVIIKFRFRETEAIS